MRIHCINLHLGTGGAARAAADYGTAWKALGHEVRLVSILSTNARTFPLQGGSDPFCLTSSPNLGALYGISVLPFALFRAVRYCTHFRRDLFVIVHFVPAIIFLIPLRLLRIKYAYIEHTDSKGYWESARSKRRGPVVPVAFYLCRHVARHASLFGTVSSQGTKRAMAKYGIKAIRATTFLNYFDGTISPAPPQPPSGLNYCALMVGRLESGKGFDHLPGILSGLFTETERSGIGLTILLAGDGAMRGILEEECSDFIDSGKLVICGYVGPEKLAALYSQSQVFLAFSELEGFSLAMRDALAYGHCIISTDCFTGPREMLGVPTRALLDCEDHIVEVVPCEAGFLIPLDLNPTQMGVTCGQILISLASQPERLSAIRNSAQMRASQYHHPEQLTFWRGVLSTIHDRPYPKEA